MANATLPLDSFMDGKEITLVESPSGTRHVEDEWSRTLCGTYIDKYSGWHLEYLTSLRTIGRLSKNPRTNKFCSRCASKYKYINNN